MALPRPGPNMSAIAAALGVSAATVSNALSGKGRVSPELIEKVRAKASELGYVPSLTARALRTGRTGVLGLVLPDIANPLFPQIAQAIENAASNAGYGVLIADSRGDIAAQTEAIGRLLERGVDGMVIVPRRGTRIADVGCPVAVIDTPSTPGNTVSADHWDGGSQMGRHLAELGHRKVLLIGTSASSNVQNDRIGGLKAGLGAQVECDTMWIEKVEAVSGEGCPLGLADKARAGFTAFAAVSDLSALRALTELQRAGIGVPETVSVTGFDDLIWSAVVTPALTTVRMDMATIADLAIAALIRAIEPEGEAENGAEEVSTGNVISETDRVPMQLIVRQSTAAPHAGRIPNLHAPTPNKPTAGEITS
ncbi:LacI family DNA-binding transcriptional regulator [Neorhizobium galegae]|uniref:LacI family DNA-binding transcriptional regulator n=1 Tax=Neorhizobium galegae TaxID=399 RepID=UPI000627D0EA|nr:LacI family DNA-binding transcriptional regulator [Neorhizobium galegae]MCM2497145.1 LacI family transcriptional regulator [Neorhizobium galegae]MCQ1771213.1 LacI family transcriptional regulator [Neorhizobium galegae]MCQ1779925.1 LacI family transcriptional regulator [Neorhizobium galegae]MCQ1794189.1 LacI family transcriptional regulator [Neorhizobium galegae]